MGELFLELNFDIHSKAIEILLIGMFLFWA